MVADSVESLQTAKGEWMIKKQWKEAFLRTVQHYENAGMLRSAAQDERLADWTAYLTGAVVQTCDSLGWMSAAKGNKLHILPVPHCEYLTLDVMAFAPTSAGGWCFPVADRMNLKGETCVVVGNRNDSATFPYRFFKWWQLDKNTGNFNVM